MNEQEIKAKRLSIVEDVAKHYTSTNRAASLETNSCQYAPIEGVSEGCAVGRLIADKELCKLMDTRGCSINSVSQIFSEMVPQELKDLDLEFLRDLQIIHDEPSNWNSSGLSTYGQESIERIINRYCK